MVKLRLAATLVASLLLLPGKVLAVVVHEQLPGTTSSSAYISSTVDLFGSSPGFRAADDFTLGADALITDVHWWGFSNSQPPSYNFSFTFYGDNGGVPGSVLHVTGGTLAQQPDGPFPFSGVVLYSSILASPFGATGGTTYWLSVFNGAPDSRWLWLIADDAGNGAIQRRDPDEPWASIPDDLAFQLTSEPVPEPATMLLLGSGLLGLIGLKRRSSR